MDFRKTVLLIGDNRTELDWLIQAFKELQASLEYIFADTPESGLRILKRRYIDLVFVKYTLNKNFGLLFLSGVKSYRKFSRLRIFLFGDQLADEQVKMARRLGAAGCIESKSDRASLQRELKAILDPQLLPSFVFFARTEQQLFRSPAEETFFDADSIAGKMNPLCPPNEKKTDDAALPAVKSPVKLLPYQEPFSLVYR